MSVETGFYARTPNGERSTRTKTSCVVQFDCEDLIHHNDLPSDRAARSDLGGGDSHDGRLTAAVRSNPYSEGAELQI
jgi:hypothetical protein